MAKRKRLGWTRDWWTIAGAAAVVLALVFASFGAVSYMSRPSVETETSAYTPPAYERLPRLAVLGDSYSAGAGNKVVWPSLLAKERNWYVNNVAVGGTGYVADPEKSYPTKGGQSTQKDPDIIIVAGSRNDQFDPGLIFNAASTLYADLKAKAPQAQIFVIGPIWDASAPPAGVVAANNETRSAATAAGLPFIDALAGNWLGDPALIQVDNIHPTDDGQRVLAEQINAVIPEIDPSTLD